MKARWLWLVMVVFLFVGGTAQTAWARAGCFPQANTCFLVAARYARTAWARAGCFRQANTCFLVAAGYTSWWGRFTGSLDCELDLVSCVRSRLLGV